MYNDKAGVITHSGPNPKVFFDLKVRNVPIYTVLRRMSVFLCA